MEKVEKKENQITLIAQIEDSLANAIRRYTNHIQIAAIDDVEILKNDSPLYDETIAHRLGLIPVKTEKSMENTNLKFKLSSKKEGAVYSEEIKGNADIIYGKIPITVLTKGQELEINATGRLGKGTEHAKFSPGLVYYRDVSEITMDKSVADKIKKIIPESDLKEKGDKIIVKDNKRKEVVDFCEGVCEKEGKNIEIKPTGELIITIESFGQITPEEIFKKSIEQLKKDLSEISKKVSK